MIKNPIASTSHIQNTNFVGQETSLNLQVVGGSQPTLSSEQVQSREKLQMLEERLKVIEGSNYDIREVVDLCLVPDVIIAPKFKVSKFPMCSGISCPKGHLTMYYRKMVAHTRNEKLLIHCFQDSLTEATLNWYMHIKQAHIRSWKDLVYAFLKQYRYNIYMTLDRFELQMMSKKNGDTFKEYAQRWQEVATQVKPPSSDKETMMLFIDTL